MMNGTLFELRDPRSPHAMSGAELTLLHEPGPRWLLWVDGVGGYLVCEGTEVIVGQPVPGFRVDVPVQGDLSRQHALIRRDGEGYVLTPRRTTRLNEETLEQPAALLDGALLEFGVGVRMRFRRPHRLSGTARLEMVSSHMTRPRVDAVLLLAESLVLGPSASSHVPCRDWAQELVLFRQGEQLFCRGGSPLLIDGQPAGTLAEIRRSSRIECGQSVVALEPVA